MRERIQTSDREARPLLWVGLAICAATALMVAWPSGRGDEAWDMRNRAVTASISGGERDIDASIVEAATLSASERQELIDELLRFAVVNGNRISIDALLRAGANVNAPGYGRVTILMLNVVAPDAEDIAQQLLAAGADVNARDVDGRTALMDATEAGREGLVAVLIAA